MKVTCFRIFLVVSCNGQVAKDGYNGHLCKFLARHFTSSENITLNACHLGVNIFLIGRKRHMSSSDYLNPLQR